VDIVEARAVDLRKVYDIMRQLRSIASFPVFGNTLTDLEGRGYKLFAAVENGDVVGLVGFRFVESFARGLFVDIDDLVVDQNHQKEGKGKILLDFVKEYSKKRAAKWMFLNARKEAIQFYEHYGMEFHGAPTMRYSLSS